MTITVAIPCYNGGTYISGCIESLLAQTSPPDAILVVDDGSTDQSATIISHYPVRLVSHEQNKGLAAARNTALSHASTELIAYVDADATADPSVVERLVAVFNNASIAGAGGRGIEAVQETIYDRWRSLHASQGYGQRFLPKVDHLYGLCMAYRREVLQAIGGFDNRLRSNAEDLDIGYRLVDAGYSLVYEPQAVVYHKRQDTFESLRRAMHQWYYWAFIVKRKNRRNPWTLAFGTLKRVLYKDTIPDLVRHGSFALAALDFKIALVKMNALLLASREKS
jgi:GT2 family glycosyltransferase